MSVHLMLITPKRKLLLAWLGSTCCDNNEDINIDNMIMVSIKLNNMLPRPSKKSQQLMGNHSRVACTISSSSSWFSNAPCNMYALCLFNELSLVVFTTLNLVDSETKYKKANYVSDVIPIISQHSDLLKLYALYYFHS